MSYYVRYVSTDERPVSLPELEQALQQIDPWYEIDGDLILLGEQEYGLIDVTFPGDPMCDEELELLREWAEEKKHRAEILASLQNARSVVTVQALHVGSDLNTLEILKPLFEWLLTHRTGIVADEGGAFFNRSGPLD